MLVISHRGNLNGSISSLENSPEYAKAALNRGYEVEIDLWYNKEYKHLTTGHSHSQHNIKQDFLHTENIWFHAKNIDALELLIELEIKKFFYHDRDAYALTSNGYIWTFTGEPVLHKSIVMFPEKLKEEQYINCTGVCTDYARNY